MIKKTLASVLTLMAVAGALFVSAERISFVTSEVPACEGDILLARLSQNADIVVLDVRSRQEVGEQPSTLANLMHIPLQELDRRLDEIQDDRLKEIIVVCPNGNRSRLAVRKLRRAGYDAMVLSGGLEALALEEKI